MKLDREGLLDRLAQAMPAWQVRSAQFNDRVAAQLGIVPSDLQALFVLHRGGPTTPGDLAVRTGLTSGAASRLVDRLVAAGMVTRTPDPHDRRRMIVTLQARARRRLLARYDPLDAALREALGGLPVTTLRQFLAFIEQAEETTRRLVDDDPIVQ